MHGEQGEGWILGWGANIRVRGGRGHEEQGEGWILEWGADECMGNSHERLSAECRTLKQTYHWYVQLPLPCFWSRISRRITDTFSYPCLVFDPGISRRITDTFSYPSLVFDPRISRRITDTLRSPSLVFDPCINRRITDTFSSPYHGFTPRIQYPTRIHYLLPISNCVAVTHYDLCFMTLLTIYLIIAIYCRYSVRHAGRNCFYHTVHCCRNRIFNNLPLFLSTRHDKKFI